MQKQEWKTLQFWIKLAVYFIISILASIQHIESGFACMENPCFHGICIDYLDINSSASCYCQNGFTGYSCAINYDDCYPNPCNVGACIDGWDTFNCSCPSNFAGSLCQYDLSDCQELCAQNNGTCIIDENSNETMCICPLGFSGPQCELDISVCNTTGNVCNRGQCVEGKCKCEEGFKGKMCETEVDQCELLQPCENGGICVLKELNDFGCACQFGYTGKTCNKKLKICEVNPCKNGAFCLHEDEDEDKKTCYCVPDFHGELCELQYQDCEPAPKCNGGTCIDGVAEFTCICPPDFFGPLCLCTAENMTDPSCHLNETIIPSHTQELPYPSATATISSGISVSVQPTFLFTSSIAQTEDFDSTIIISTETAYISDSTVFMDSSFSLSTMIELELSSSKLEESETLSTFSSFITMSLFPTPTSTSDIFPSEDFQTITLISEEMSSSNIDASSSISESIQPEKSLSSEIMSIVESSINTQSTISLPDDDLVTSTISPTISLESVFSTGTFTSTEEAPTEPTISYDFTTIVLESGYEESVLYPSTASHFPELSLNSLSLTSTPSLTLVVSETFTLSSSQISLDFSDSVSSTFFNPGESEILTSSDKISNDSNYSTTFIMTTTVIESESSLSVEESSSSIDAFPEPSTTSIYFEQSITVSFPITTPEASISIPTPTPHSPFNESQTDPCYNYCFNHGKCISDSIELACICPFKYSGSRCETMKKKFNTSSFTGDSFLGYKVPNDSINRINVKTTMATNAPDGILFYTSSSLGRLYALIFTQGGHITLHFSCGAQSMHFVETRTRVDNGHNFTLEFSMEMVSHGVSDIHCVGQVSVNHSYIMRGEQIVGQNELYENTIQVIYIGGVDTENARKNDDLIAVMSGFRGCVYSLSINEEIKDLFDDAIDGKEVSECSAFGCVNSPCFGSSKCVPWNKFPFWQCICSPGFQGIRCTVRVCDSNPCMNGATCTLPPEEIIQLTSNSTDITQIPSPPQETTICLCPLGFSGLQCQYPLNISKPSFKPVNGFDYSAFIAYEPIPRFSDWVQLKLHFVTRNISQISLLLYSGYTQSLSSSITSPDQLENLSELVKNNSPQQLAELTNSDDSITNIVSDFFAITYVQGYIALTWNLGSGTQRIISPSRIDRRLNVHTLYAGRAGRQAWLKVDGMRNVTGKSPGPFHRLNVNTELFVGGYETFRFEGLPHDLPAHNGWEGCIFDFGFRVKNRLYLPKALRGRNIKNCYEEDC